MKSIASRIGLSLLLVALLLASGALPAQAAATVIMENTVMVPVSGSILVSCANGGAGELVDFTGNFHYMRRFTGSSGGPVSYQMQALTQNVTGIGEVTGDSYVYSGGFMETGVFPNLTDGEMFTSFFDFRVIGQGSGNNFVVHTIWHHTYNANGDPVVDFVLSNATCV